MRSRRTMSLAVVLFIGLAAPSAQTGDGQRDNVLIRAPKPYGPVVQRIEALGGHVTHQYKYWDGLAAELPRAAMAAVTSLVGPSAITKDLVVPAPESVGALPGRAPASVANSDVATSGTDPLGETGLANLAAATPQAYLLNNAIANVSPLHARGITGAGVVVAVIDSGIRPGFPHISLDGSVVGCEDFVGDTNGCSHFDNGGHGTFVAGMISSNVVFAFSTASPTRNAVLAECPGCFLDPPTYTRIPMIGSAPLSSIYALRVFGPSGGAPTSRILAAMERAIDLREDFDAGLPGGANIRVVNMSLAGSTVFAARDLFDMATNAFLDHDIVAVIAAANSGPSSLTIGSPGSALGALTVGAASLAHNERILRRLQLGAAVGALYRPFLGAQTAYFSARGPNADGRADPDVISNGFANYGQGLGTTTNSISIASGTSFSTPSVAGVAALLRQAFPGATARQIRNAIVMAANPSLLADGSGPLDQGAGYVNALGAHQLLDTGLAPDTVEEPGNPAPSVKVNVEQNTSLNVRDGFVVEHAAGLEPGQRHDILYRVHPGVRQVIVTLANVTPSLPAAEQNQLFGDDILLAVHSAKVSAIGEGDYKVFEFTTGGTFAIDDPETGLMRVTLNGDWTNAGGISADVAILSLTDPLPQFTAQGRIDQGALLQFPVTVPAGVSKAEFRLGWRQDWGNYPAADIDLILVKPNGDLIVDGATLNNPEAVLVDNPAPGPWMVLVSGFEIHTTFDRFELRVSLDGKVVR